MPSRGRSTSRAKSPAKPKRSASPAKPKRSASPKKRAANTGKSVSTPTVNATEKYKGIDTAESGYEFGGPIGVTSLMIWSHYILLYFW